MKHPIRRRAFLAAAPGAVAVGLGQAPQPKIPDRGPALDKDLVKEFVAVAHTSLEKTTALIEQQPALINSAHDWGGGDFETALGGASHMGNKPIALYLLEKGARMDLFAAAMLGKLDVVKAVVAAFPGAHKALGPHKIPLLAHAQRGGAEAEPVVKFLETLEKT